MAKDKDNYLKLLSEANWDDILPKLLLSAERYCQAMFPNGITGEIIGKTYKDIVMESITDTYAGAGKEKGVKGERVWKPDEVDLIHHLYWVFRSKVDQLRKLDEFKKTTRIEEDFDHFSSDIDCELEKREEKIETDAIFKKLEIALNDDKEALDVLTVYRCLGEDGNNVGNKQIAEELKINVSSVENAKKRISTKLLKVAKEKNNE